MDDFYKTNLFAEEVNVGLIDEVEKEPARTTEGVQSGGFNIFALTDAIGERDKRRAWIIYEQALASGLVADEIFYRVFWGIKSLLLTAKSNGADEAMLNPFVYKKNKSFLKNWQTEELEELLKQLTVGLHEARRGIFDLENFLGRLILSI